MESHFVMPPADSAELSNLRGGLLTRSFISLIVTQLLGTVNDNMFRWLSVGIAKHLMGAEQTALSLSLGLFGFTLPYLVFATHAGYFADRFSKRRVIVCCKIAEVLIVLLGLLAIASRSTTPLFLVVMLLGAQAALFGPAKFGSLPEILSSDKLSLGNGVMGLVTVCSAAAGSIAGYWLFEKTGPDGNQHLQITAVALVGVAVLGWLASLGVRSPGPVSPTAKFPWNPFRDTVRQLRLLWSTGTLFRTALGIAFFWTLASLAQMNIEVFGGELQRAPHDVGWMMGVLVAGVGLGSVLAGWWSAGKVELGIVPLGAAGIVASSLALVVVGSNPDLERAYHLARVWLFLLGLSAGLFSVPLDSFLQQQSPAASRGSLLAASNFVSFLGILLVSVAFYVMQGWLGISARGTFLIAGIGTIPVALYVVFLLPDATLRFQVWCLTRFIYRVRVYGMENIPETGGALLVANHVSWVDGVLLLVTTSRPVRMMAYADYVNSRALKWLSKIYRVIPIKAEEGPKALLRSLQTARQAIIDGDVVCIFAEGALTRTGQLQPFQRGLLKIVDGTGAPVIPVYLDGLWGSIFSFRDGKFFWKRPRKWRYPVGILFGRPLPAPDDVHQVRRAVEDLGVEAVEKRKHFELTLPRAFLRRCRRSLLQTKIADSSGQQLTGGQLLLKTLLVKRVLERQFLAADEPMVGVILPPSIGGVLVNAALPLAGRVPVNLNYTSSAGVMNSCIAQCGIKHVVTSRKLVERLHLALNAEFVYLDDFAGRATLADKLVAGLQAFLTPVVILERLFGLTRISPNDLLTVVFTSGSTGEPKGVMLSHFNVASNIDAIDQLFQLDPTDTFIGVLPFFHSMGYTATLWTVLTLDPKGVYHFNPLDARQIGELCERHKATIMIATPTFLRSYIKRCEPHQLKTVDLVVVGAEKMPIALAQAFEDRFGVRPIEGYGTTELSPLAAVNVPDHRSTSFVQKGTKEGTVGRAIPGTAAKVIDPETGVDLGLDQPGMLLIKGPNVMQGYWQRPDLTAQVLKAGWYSTGDIARLDEEGFIQITDRQSRFSKIGGEMVPHLKIEEALAAISRSTADDDAELNLVVTAVPDEKKGERLVVIHRPLAKPLEQVYSELAASDLPNLWIPSRDSFIEVAEIPVLGTGKVDLRALKLLALERFGKP